MTAKIDVNVDFTHKICASMMLPSLRFLCFMLHALIFIFAAFSPLFFFSFLCGFS